MKLNKQGSVNWRGAPECNGLSEATGRLLILLSRFWLSFLSTATFVLDPIILSLPYPPNRHQLTKLHHFGAKFRCEPCTIRGRDRHRKENERRKKKRGSENLKQKHQSFQNPSRLGFLCLVGGSLLLLFNANFPFTAGLGRAY